MTVRYLGREFLAARCCLIFQARFADAGESSECVLGRLRCGGVPPLERERQDSRDLAF